MEYESEAIDRAIYRDLNIDDFQTREHRIQLILAILDQWDMNKEDVNKVTRVLEEVLPEVE